MKFTIENLQRAIQDDKTIKSMTWDRLTKNTQKWLSKEDLDKIPTEQKEGAYKQGDEIGWTIPYRYINTKERALERTEDLLFDRYRLSEQLGIDMETEIGIMADYYEDLTGDSMDDMGLEDQIEDSILSPFRNDLYKIRDHIKEME